MKNNFVADYLCYKSVKDQIWDILVGPWLPNNTRFKLGIFLGGEEWIFFSISPIRERWWVWLALFWMNLDHLASASKSKTISFVSSVPFRDPTAHTYSRLRSVKKNNRISWWENRKNLTSFVGEERILQTTPPEPPDSSATKSRMKSPAQVKCI